jgi:hypothetical protein
LKEKAPDIFDTFANRKSNIQHLKVEKLKVIVSIIGVLLAATGGVIAYRALFLEPDTTIVITNTDVHQYPNTLRVLGGLLLLLVGACVAFFGARRSRA